MFLYEKSCHGAPDVALTTTQRQHVGARGTAKSQCLATAHFSMINHLGLLAMTKKVFKRIVRSNRFFHFVHHIPLSL